MVKLPTIPMCAEDAPQQRIYLVVDLPPRPEGFIGQVDWIEKMPEKHRPTGSPRKLEYLAGVEWAWSLMNSRIDAYYLGSKGPYWLLWVRYYDDNEFPARWVWRLYAYGPKKGVSERQAAVYLLLDAWSAEKDEMNLDAFHWVNEAGALSIADLSAIERAVWR